MAGPADPVAYVLCGGTANPNVVVGGNGITRYDDWALQSGPKMEIHGVKRVFMRSPGGIWLEDHLGNPFPDTNVRINDWLIAEAVGAPYAVRADLHHAMHTLGRYGIEEVIFYIGAPYQLADPVTSYPLCVEPYLEACEGTPVRATIAHDVMFYTALLPTAVFDPLQWQHFDPMAVAVQTLRNAGTLVHAEPRLIEEMIDAGMAYLCDGTFATLQLDTVDPQDMENQPPEVFRVTDVALTWTGWPEVAGWDDFITPVLRSAYNWQGATPSTPTLQFPPFI